MSIRIVLGDWDAARDAARPIRYEVFVLEQGVPLEIEWDDMDPLCVHAVAYDDGRAVGTGRLLPDGHIGRMAVLGKVRGRGIGGALLDALMAQAKARGDQTVVLNAQTHAAAFYLRHGFVHEGDEFIEAGIPHIRMRRDFV